MSRLFGNIEDKTKKLLLKILIFALLVVVVIKIPDAYKNWKNDKQPVREITCEFIGTVHPGEELSRSMIRVIAETTSGEIYDASEGYTLNVIQAPNNGSDFDVIVSYKGVNKSLTIPITRTPVVEYSIGYPDYDDVKATVYSNGDLIFTGKGEIRAFAKNGFPWSKDFYTYVDIEPAIEIRNMDYWFFKNENLSECGALPKTVESTVGTFQDCKMLKKTPDYFQCTELRLTDNMFSGCISLSKADTIPVNVISAVSMFSNCSSLETAPDVMKAGNLLYTSGMFSGCSKLIRPAQMPNSVISMSNCFSECINLHSTSVFPVKVEDISGCYAGCKSLEEAAPIPESVLNYAECFKGCRDLSGKLEINTDSPNFKSLFAGAVTAGEELRLSGNCGYLIDIQQSSKNRFIVLDDINEATRQSKRLQTELGGA